MYELLCKGVETVCTIAEQRLVEVSRRFERALLLAEGLWQDEQRLSLGDFERIFEEHTHQRIPEQFQRV